MKLFYVVKLGLNNVKNINSLIYYVKCVKITIIKYHVFYAPMPYIS